MLNSFICPDGKTTTIHDCMNRCRMAGRCAPLNYLKQCAQVRPWEGKCSTTQLINGTRQEYLKIITDYAEAPTAQAFRVIGSRGHSEIAGHEHEKSFSEEKLELEGIVGTFDCLEIEGDDVRLIDTKTSGSYRVAKAIGIVKNATDVPVLGADGQPERYKSGAKKGEVKTKKEYDFDIDPAQADAVDWTLQLNFYRLLVEKNLGYTVKNMRIFAVVRDGNTHTARSRGIDQETYMIHIDRLDDDDVLAYFRTKRDRLLAALEKKEMPPICNSSESWDGTRCARFCPVAEKCAAHGDNPWI